MKKIIWGVMLFFLLAGVGIASAEEKKGQAEYVIKIGTVVPEMGAMAEMMRDFKKEISEKTNNHVSVIVYFGAVMGDEMDIVRKMRLGQLQGGGMTLLGLGQLCPAAKVLELPFLFNNYEEIDYVVMNKLRPGFTKLFEEKGVYLMGWYDMGFGYFFFRDPIRKFEDIGKSKMVTFTGDPLFFEGEKAAGFENLIPLHISETLTGLQTGLINGTFSPYFALVGLQWNTHVKYVLNVPFSYSVAAMVVDKNYVDKMPPQYKKIVIEAMKKYEDPLNQELRRMERDTYASLLRRGLVEIPKDTTQEIVAEMKKRTRPLYDKFINEYYPNWILTGILDALAQYRQEKGTK